MSRTSNSSSQNKVRVRKLETSKDLKKLMTKYFLKAKLAAKLPWKYTAWGTSALPIEFIWGFDIFPLHPENSATVAAARKISLGLIEEAEAIGFSNDLCSYFKTNIGALEKGVGIFAGEVDKPDFCVTTGTICDTHVKWFQTQARRMNVPCFIFDIPHYVSGLDKETEERYIDYIVDQIQDYSDFVYDITGKKPSEKKFFETVQKSDRLSELWQEIYSYRKLKPSPLGFNDTFAQIFPLVLLPGIDDGIKYYEKLLAEVKKMAREGKGVVPEEKHRLLFEGIPFWFQIKYLFQLAQHGAVVVYEPYTFAFGPRKELGLSYEDSLRSFAKMWLQQPYYYNLENRIDYFKEVIDEYSIDGVILHNNRSCRPNSTGLIDLKNTLQQDVGIPVMILEADMNDPRLFSEEQVKNRTESFIELLDANK